MLLPILTLLLLSLLGIQSLFLLCTHNTTLALLARTLSANLTPLGHPLRAPVPGWRPADTQLRAVAVFQLIFSESLLHPSTSVVGAAFIGSWGATWFLTLLESWRAYTRTSVLTTCLLAWTAVPGVLVFNYSHAVVTGVYFAVWLAVKPAVTSRSQILLNPAHLRVLPWTILGGYVVPFVLMALPSRRVGRWETKHAVAAWYQQYHLWVALVHGVMLAVWPGGDVADDGPHHLAALLDRAYGAILLLAAATAHWMPLVVCSWSALTRRPNNAARKPGLGFRSVYVPPHPFRAVPVADVWVGAKGLLQWDGIVGTASTLVWAGALYAEARGLVADPKPVGELVRELVVWALVGGPMAVPVRLMYERDRMLLVR